MAIKISYWALVEVFYWNNIAVFVPWLTGTGGHLPSPLFCPVFGLFWRWHHEAARREHAQLSTKKVPIPNIAPK
ncbi:MAG: hypothetical protein ACKVP1_15615 [Burkholderiaceae bacterium]